MYKRGVLKQSCLAFEELDKNTEKRKLWLALHPDKVRELDLSQLLENLKKEGFRYPDEVDKRIS